jgi:Na+/glutamate symporter
MAVNDKNQKLRDELRAFARKQTYENKCNDPKYDEIFGSLKLGESNATLKDALKTSAEKRFAEAEHKIKALMIIFLCVMVTAAALIKITETKDLLVSLPNFTLNMSVGVIFLVLTIITLFIGSFFETERKSVFIDLQKSRGMSEADATRDYKRRFVNNN